MDNTVKIGEKIIGKDYPVFIIAEIGINHNGDVGLAKKLIDVAVKAGCSAIKFQKRNPELCVPDNQKNVIRETPWGMMTYLEYRYRVEFGDEQYKEIDKYCKDKEILWFASCWDTDSVDFIERFNPPCYKIPSACLTDKNYLLYIRSKGRLMLLSTGMSTMKQIEKAVVLLGEQNLIICHSTSTYPCENEDLNIRMINTLGKKFNVPIGYSGHEVGLIPTVAAVCMGAVLVERHITLARAMWGTDQSASVEPQGIERLVKYITVLGEALGDGVKRICPSEKVVMEKLRRVTDF